MFKNGCSAAGCLGKDARRLTTNTNIENFLSTNTNCTVLLCCTVVLMLDECTTVLLYYYAVLYYYTAVVTYEPRVTML